MNTWVVPCRYDPIVHTCVSSIRKHHPGDRIILVDSCSPDTSYIDELDVDVAILGNRHYAWGAFALAFDGEGDRWHCIHDSLIVNQALHLGDVPFAAVQWQRHLRDSAVYDPVMRAWADRTLARLGVEHPPMFDLLLGPMFFATTDAMHALVEIGAFTIAPTDRIEANGMERLGGILAHAAGLPTTDQLADGVVSKHFRDRP